MEFNPRACQQATAAAAEFGTPLYLYFPQLIEQRVAQVQTACAGFGLRYAVKTNPNPWLLQWLRGRVASLDVSSAGEIDLALRAGWSGVQLAFTGPAKTADDLHRALDAEVRSIVIEDLSEARLLNSICAERGLRTRVLVRIAPALAEEKFGVRLAGRPTQFGVDEDQLADFFAQARALDRLDIDGFHIFSGSQCIDDAALAAHFAGLWRLFKRAIELLGTPVSELVFGAGMGIPYHDGDPSLNLGELAPVVAEIGREIAELPVAPACFVELGRYLVGEAGLFVTRVVRVKNSRGSQIAICDGGMNHNLGACGHLGGVSHRHYSMRLLGDRAGGEGQQTYRVVGPLCTAIDTLAHRIILPTLHEGDLLAVGCAGSYGPSASPLFFISHKAPREVLCSSLEGPANLVDVSWLPAHS